VKQHIVKAVDMLACLKYFPAEAGAREAIMLLFERMISIPEQIEWLVRTMIDEVGEWPGPKEVRGIFCSRFKPKDGVEVYATTRLFSAVANGASAIAKSDQHEAQLTADGGSRSLQAPECERLPAEELEAFHEETIGRLVVSTTFPWLRSETRRPLVEEERAVKEAASKSTLTPEVKASRLLELRKALGLAPENE
jgi:hypothetical protein